MSITICVNNERFNVQDSITLQALLESNQDQFTPPFAIAINGEFIPRSQYDCTPLNNGDELDIVSPVGGG